MSGATEAVSSFRIPPMQRQDYCRALKSPLKRGQEINVKGLVGFNLMISELNKNG
jgi:hypothetical protein